MSDIETNSNRGDEFASFLKRNGTPSRVYPGSVEVNSRKDIIKDKGEVAFTVRWENVSLKRSKKKITCRDLV